MSDDDGDDEEFPLDGEVGDEETDPQGEFDGVERDPFEELGETETEPVDEDVFEEMETGTVDEEAVFAELSGERPEADVEEAPLEAEGETIVPKRKYCERCEYFSAPPETSCTHPGTEIHELVDMKHFRVVDCPVVENRRRLGYEE